MDNKFEHTLPVQDIIVRQDNVGDNEWIETVSGQIYPLVRIKEQVLEFSEIVSFRLRTGWDVMLPKLDITIDDSEMIFTESNYVEKGDILTIYIGNPRDAHHKPVKNDYYITNVNNVVGSKNVSITCQLNVPELFKSRNRVWAQTPSIKIMEELALECGLGFTTNMSDTDDIMDWIQSGSTAMTIAEITERSFVSGDTFIVTYIDQWANLNYIDVKKALQTKSDMKLTTMPLSGEPLKTPIDLYLTNSFRDGGGQMDDPKPVPKIIDYAPSNNYGINSGKYVNRVTVDTYDLVDRSETEAEQVEMNQQLLENSTLTTFEFGNVHENYSICRATNINSRQLLQGMNISALLDYYIPVLFNGLNVPLKIYNLVKIERNFSQDVNVGNDEINTEVESTNDGESMTFKLNNRLSGDVVVTAMDISYGRGTKANSTNRLQQTLKMFLSDKTT